MADYERVYFCFCADNCKFETMTKEQIITAIYEAVTTGEIKNIDAGFITKVKEQNKGNGLAFWLGTTAEYNAIATKDPNCFYIKTDDTALADLSAKIAAIQKAVDISASNLEKHANNKNNPHGVTAAQIGAAPSGFGIGETQGKNINDCNTALLTGFYTCALGTVNTPDADDFKYATLFVERRNTAVYQTITYQGLSAKRFATSVDDGETWTFKEWEYENPPLYSDVEYRTTERYNGKPVYIKAATFGALPNNTAEGIIIGKKLNIISIEGYAVNGRYTIPLLVLPSINSIYYDNTDGLIYIETKANVSTFTATLIVKYTK